MERLSLIGEAPRSNLVGEAAGCVVGSFKPVSLFCMNNMRILIADDVNHNMMVMSERLSRINSLWSVVQYENAEDAVSAAKKNKSHLIVMEEQFGPGKMTGTEAIQALRADEEANCQTRSVIVSWTAILMELPPGADFTWPKDANATIMQEAIDRALATVGH